MLSLQQNIKSESFARIGLDLSYNFLFTPKYVLKCLFYFYSTAVVLEFVFVHMNVWEWASFSNHIILLLWAKEISVLWLQYLQIAVFSALWPKLQHLGGSFRALCDRMAWALEIASGNDFSPWYQRYFAFLFWMLEWTVNPFTCIKNFSHRNHPDFELKSLLVLSLCL